ncbi:MAG: right-handed parallel beta-helix repeat-containing protein, partial [Alphaproteobacteria bacterium]
GIRMNGPLAAVIACTTESNGLDGIRIDGTDAVLDGNQSGTLKDDGNGGFGFVVNGMGANVYQNTAEANAGGGFLVAAPTVRFKANSSTSTGGPGFRFTGGGSGLDSNRSEFNGGFEFDLAPGNLDESGNRANGNTITFGPEGGKFE